MQRNATHGRDMEDRIICAKERRQLVPYSDVQVWRLERDGKFPKRVKLGASRVGWLHSEIMDWIASRKAERDAAAAA